MGFRYEDVQGAVSWTRNEFRPRVVFFGETKIKNRVVVKADLVSDTWREVDGKKRYGRRVWYATKRRSIELMAALRREVEGTHFPQVGLFDAQQVRDLFSNIKEHNKECYKYLREQALPGIEFQNCTPVWLGMEFVPNLKDFELPRDDEVDPKALHDWKTKGKDRWRIERVNIVTRSPIAFHDLGVIAALDLFLGNFDRFAPLKMTFSISSRANIFATYSTDATSRRMVGIDFFDHNSTLNNLYEDITTDQLSRLFPAEPSFPASFLTGASGADANDDSTPIYAFAANVVKGLYGVTEASPTAADQSKHANNFILGFQHGLLQIKTCLVNEKWLTAFVVSGTKLKGSFWPAQLKHRSEALGWSLPHQW